MKCYIKGYTQYCICIFLCCILFFNASVIAGYSKKNFNLKRKQQNIQNISIKSEWIKIGSNIYLLRLYGKIPQGNHLYSIHLKKNEFPIPTKLEILHKNFVPIEPLKESEPTLLFDAVIGKKVKIHKHFFQLTQKFEVKPHNTKATTEVPVKLTYQICNEKICFLPISLNILSHFKF